MFYEFDSKEHFDQWHNQLKIELGYPLEDGITTEYTKLEVKENGQFYAFVDEIHATGLIQTDRAAQKEKK